MMETDHTVSDGKTTQMVLNNLSFFQGKIQRDTHYKEVPRDEHGRFTQPAITTRVDLAPILFPTAVNPPPQWGEC